MPVPRSPKFPYDWPLVSPFIRKKASQDSDYTDVPWIAQSKMPTPYLSAAFVTLALLLFVVRRIFHRRGIKRIPGPPSPSLLFGMRRHSDSPVVDSDSVRLGHDFEYASQEEACSLEFKWMHEYGPTWRTRGAFGVCPPPDFLLCLRLMNLRLL